MIAYASRTGNVRYIATKLKAECVEISEELQLNRPYLLITYTDGLGDIPAKVAQFLEIMQGFAKALLLVAIAISAIRHLAVLAIKLQ